MESIVNQINKSVSNHKRGKLFFPNDFIKFGTSTSVRQARSAKFPDFLKKTN